MTFKDFNFKQELNKATEVAGYKEPSPIQEMAIPVVLSGKDMVGQAHTGTGKTAAFGLPILNMLDLDNTVEAVVIVPTRELAVQVSDELYKFGKFLDINTATVYGGQSYNRQIKHIKSASVIVATPGRFLDLLKSKQIEITPKYIVLDEADEMLDMGFLDDIKEILSHMPSAKQTLLFSATMPPAIKALAKNFLNDPEFISVTDGKRVTNDKITQSFYVVNEYERDEALMRLIDYKNPEKSIIFCRTKLEVDRLSSFLISQGYATKGLHGDLEQRQREEVIKAFKQNRLEILIATDVAARGLDISDVTHVFNYHIPFDGESYVHRIGRTGRAGKEGVAVSLVTPSELYSLKKIQKISGGSLVAKVIPTIDVVKSQKTDTLIEKIREHEIKDSATAIIDRLVAEGMDFEEIASRLASLISKESQVSGKDKIGKSLNDITELMNRQRDGGNSRGRNRGGRGGNGGRGGYNRNRNRSGGRGGRRNSNKTHDNGNRNSGHKRRD